MTSVLLMLMAFAASELPAAREASQDWRKAEQAWRRAFQTTHKDFRALVEQPEPEVTPTPLPPERPLLRETRRRYAVLPARNGFQVLRIEYGRVVPIDRPWDSQKAAEYAIADLARRDQTAVDQALQDPNSPARPIALQANHRGRKPRPAIRP